MGRGGKKKQLVQKSSALNVSRRGASGAMSSVLKGPVDIDPNSYYPDPLVEDGAIGSEAHRMRMELLARTMLGRRDVTIRIMNFCASCKHPLESHSGNTCAGAREEFADLMRSSRYYSTTDDFHCGCPEFIPGGFSATDMSGNIVIQSTLPPPPAPPSHREIAAKGFLYHEICHEMYTHPATYFSFVEELKNNQTDKSNVFEQQKTLHNILEDGMIEERLRSEDAYAYETISALNRVFPRSPKESYVVERDTEVLDPGYEVLDADGNPILQKVQQVHPVTGALVEGLIIPAGTRMSDWGKGPVSKADQIMRAIHMEALPEHEVGELDPDVQAVFEKCKPHIDAAVRGNTADCVVRTRIIHSILRENGLMDDTTPIQVIVDPPPGDGKGPDGDGPPQDPNGKGKGPTQKPQNGEEEPPEGGGSGGEKGDEDKDAEDGDSGEDGDKKDGEKDEEKDGDSGKDGEKDEEKDGDSGEDKKDGEDGDSGKDGEKNKEKSFESQVDSDGNLKGKDQATSSKGGEDSSSHNKDAPLPKGTREKNESSQKGRVSESKIQEMEEKTGKDLQDIADHQKRLDSMQEKRKGRGDLENGTTISQGALTDGVIDKGQAFPEEHGRLRSLGHQLADELDQIKAEQDRVLTRRKEGRMDAKRMHRGVHRDEKIYKRTLTSPEVDMRIEVVLDRSGSVTNNVDFNHNQWRMAKTCGEAGIATEVPIGIIGYSGSYDAEIYVYKEADSSDTRAVDSMFQTGGGGTPTQAGVAAAGSRISGAPEKEKIMIVVTDGDANDTNAVAEEVRKAREEGIVVVGVGFADVDHNGDVRGGPTPESMDISFGAGNWQTIHDYNQVPGMVAEMIRERALRSQ